LRICMGMLLAGDALMEGRKEGRKEEREKGSKE
jgi:hypothetical protein